MPPSTRDRLLTAAVDLLIEKGSFDQVSLRAIASGAGVSPTAVYRHFADHAALLDAVAAWCWEQFDAAVFGHELDPVGADPADYFLRCGQGFIAFAREYPGIYRVLMDQRFDDVNRVDDGRVVFAKLVDAVARILAVNGDHRDPELVALLVHTWIHGIATLHLPPVAGEPSADDLLSELGCALGLVCRPAAVVGDGSGIGGRQ
ncbi:MAG: TetR/AcrR family transcriptional regulator [Acidimicrobiales bacterium]